MGRTLGNKTAEEVAKMNPKNRYYYLHREQLAITRDKKRDSMRIFAKEAKVFRSIDPLLFLLR